MNGQIIQYLHQIKVLIVDQNAGALKYLSKLCEETGIEESHISVAHSFDEATRALLRSVPEVLICDDQLGGELVLKLIQDFKNKKPPHETLFFLLTKNTSQASIGRYAEEEIDGFLLRPFTGKYFKEVVLHQIEEKILPSDYCRVIQAGKEQSFRGLVDQALATFESAKGLHQKSSNAYFYAGQVNEVKANFEQSLESYQICLKANPLHFKTLNAMYQLYSKEGQPKEAYATLKRLISLYPANQERLALGVKMAVKQACFKDVEGYYEYFANHENPGQDLVNHICSGLAVNGKYYLIHDKIDEAILSFERAYVHGQGEKKYLEFITETLTAFGHSHEVKNFLSRFEEINETFSELASNSNQDAA